MTPVVNAIIAVHVALEVEQMLFHAYHWRSRGADYYGDHLLYQRLYEARAEEIDRIGEVLMALGGPSAVSPVTTLTGMLDLTNRAERLMATDAQRAVTLVEETLHRINDANNLLGKDAYALAVNNALAGIADKHLEALYLLRQRVGK